MTVPRKAVLLLVAVVAVLWSSASAHAGPIDVPEDFPGNFRMDLLAIDIFVDRPSTSTGLGSATVNPTELGINFSASAFDGDGTPDWGTSTLTTLAQSFLLGGTQYLLKDIELFINSGGPGTLTDLGNGTGDWELTVPLRVDYDGSQVALFDVTLSTSSTFSYYDQLNVLQSVSGQAMDYATGDALLVAQAMLDQGPLSGSGLRGTLVINGNDPVVVPEPSSILLVAIGLIGLASNERLRRA